MCTCTNELNIMSLVIIIIIINIIMFYYYHCRFKWDKERFGPDFSISPVEGYISSGMEVCINLLNFSYRIIIIMFFFVIDTIYCDLPSSTTEPGHSL